MRRLSRSLILLVILGLTACTRAELTPRAVTPTLVPELQMPRAVATFDPALLPTPTDTPVPTPTDTPTLAPTATPQPTPTPTRVPLTPTPTSSGPLSAAVYVANCRLAPTAEKPGNLIVRISIEAAGGSGSYRYFYQNLETAGKFIDIAWERGSRLIGQVTVFSVDGQTAYADFNLSPGELDCH